MSETMERATRFIGGRSATAKRGETACRAVEIARESRRGCLLCGRSDGKIVGMTHGGKGIAVHSECYENAGKQPASRSKTKEEWRSEVLRGVRAALARRV